MKTLKSQLVAAVAVMILAATFFFIAPHIQQAVASPPPPPPPSSEPQPSPPPNQPPPPSEPQQHTQQPPAIPPPGSRRPEKAPLCPEKHPVTREHALHDLWEAYRAYNATVQELEKTRESGSFPEEDVSYLLSLFKQVYLKARNAYQAGDYRAAAAYAHLAIDVIHAVHRVAGLCPMSPPPPPGPPRP